MKVLVACEFSGIVRDAFIHRGHEALSCDLRDTEIPGPHYCGDVRDIIHQSWDLMIAHPPCTDLAVSGARHFEQKGIDRIRQSLLFVRFLMKQEHIPMIAIENPISIISTWIRPPDQIIQPWMFGHGETKSTCLWLKNLPKLKSTKVVKERENRIHELWKTTPNSELGRLRSITYKGIAEAMANQWGSLSVDEDIFNF